jgi:hypothetical protein
MLPFNLSLYIITIARTLGCLISCTYVWPNGEEVVSTISGRCYRLLFRVNITFVVILIGWIVTTKEIKDAISRRGE